MKDHSPLSRRSVLGLIAGVSNTALAGCLNDNDNRGTSPSNGNGVPDNQNTLKRVAVEGTTLVVELTAEADIDQINLIQSNGVLFGEQGVDAGVTQVSFDIRNSYTPGEYRLLAIKGEETVVETSVTIQPEINIRDIGTYRNNPDMPWDEVYGESQTDTKKNGEAYVTVENTGSGPEAIIKLRFTGDLPHLAEDYNGSGLYEKEQVVVAPSETVDLYSDTLPFGAKISEKGMGCSPDGNSGQFTIAINTRAEDNRITKTYAVTYSGSEEMHDCNITIGED